MGEKEKVSMKRMDRG